MVIWCEINLFNHSDNAYKPGDTVRGIVKYVLTEDTVFSKITVSLKGSGHLEIEEDKHTDFYSEAYVDINDIVLDNKEDNIIPIVAGTHELPFMFTIPENVPPTFKCYRNTVSYMVHYEISYYIRIKFERWGDSIRDNRFKTNIYVANIVTPNLPTSPTTYGLEKKPFQIFMAKDKTIRIQLTVENSVTIPAGHVKMFYKIDNNTNLHLQGVEITLTKELTIERDGELDINDCETLAVHTAPAIEPGTIQSSEYIMNIPSGVMTLRNANHVSRNYFINIIAQLPFPHRDAVLKVPIEIMDEGVGETLEGDEYCEPSHSYLEVMTEYKKDEFRKNI